MRMPLALVSITSWGASHWVLLSLSALLVGSYFGWVTWAMLDRAIERLAVYSPSSFGQAPSERGESLFIVFGFLLLTLPSILAGILVLTFVVMVGSGLVEPLTRRIGVPTAVPRLASLGALVWVGAAYREAWFPWIRRAVGLVAAAYLALTR